METQVGSNYCQSILHTYIHKDTVDSWTTGVWALGAHLYADIFQEITTILHDLLVADWISEHRAPIWRSDYNVICRVSTLEGLPSLMPYCSRVNCKNKTLSYTPTYIQSLEIHVSQIIHIYLYHDTYIFQTLQYSGWYSLFDVTM